LKSDLYDSFYTFYTKNSNETELIGYGIRELEQNEFNDFCTGPVKKQFTNIPKLSNKSSLERIKSSFSYRFYASNCYFLNRSSYNWSSEGVQLLADSNMTHSHCLTEHLTDFTSGLQVLKINIDFNYVFLHGSFAENPTIYLTIIIVTSIYILMFIWCLIMDKKDKTRSNIYVLKDNGPYDSYFYELVFFTGNRTNAGTQSNVIFFLLYLDSISKNKMWRFGLY
jgi:hypothetical protein